MFSQVRTVLPTLLVKLTLRVFLDFGLFNVRPVWSVRCSDWLLIFEIFSVRRSECRCYSMFAEPRLKLRPGVSSKTFGCRSFVETDALPKCLKITCIGGTKIDCTILSLVHNHFQLNIQFLVKPHQTATLNMWNHIKLFQSNMV